MKNTLTKIAGFGSSSIATIQAVTVKAPKNGKTLVGWEIVQTDRTGSLRTQLPHATKAQALARAKEIRAKLLSQNDGQETVIQIVPMA